MIISFDALPACDGQIDTQPTAKSLCSIIEHDKKH